MPAGNDTAEHAAFRSSVESQYGSYTNAEELIRSHAASLDPALRRAGLSRKDDDATAKLIGDLKGTAGKFKGVPDGAVLVSAAVRGNAIIGVFEDANGVPFKLVTGANADFERGLTDEQRLARARAESERHVAEETARLRREAEERVATARAEAEQKVQEELAKIREKADADLEKGSSEGEKPAGKPAGKSQPASTKGTTGQSDGEGGGAGPDGGKAS